MNWVVECHPRVLVTIKDEIPPPPMVYSILGLKGLKGENADENNFS